MDPQEHPTPPESSPSSAVNREDLPANPYEQTTNPYADAALTGQANPIDSSPLAPPAPDSLRAWTPLAVVAVSGAVFIFFSFVMALVAVLVVHGEIDPASLRDQQMLADVSRSRVGLFLLVAVPQLALVMPCLFAAGLSPEPFRRRLGLVRGHWPIWAWFAAAAATPMVGLISGVVVDQFLDESEALKEMSQIFRNHGQNGFLIPLALMIGATPAICEELLFRGYVQTRMARSFGPLFGILMASFLFAAFHLDPVHVIAVFPLGLFLGLVSWRSGSIFPAMMGHFVNNVISVVGVVLAPEEQTDVLAAPVLAVSLVILLLGTVGTASLMVAMIYYGDPNDRAAAGSGLESRAAIVTEERPTFPRNR